MKILSRIQNKPVSENSTLFICLGSDFAAYAVTDPGAAMLEELCYTITDEWTSSKLSNWLKEFSVLTSSFKTTAISFDHRESLMVPSSVYKKSDTNLYLEVLYGFKGNSTCTDFIPGWQLYNVYAQPPEITEWVKIHFPQATIFHRFTSLLLNGSAGAEGGQILLDIRRDDFMLMALRDGKLLINRAFDYSTPEDVLFALLSVCRETGLSQQTVQLELSGLIDQQSALYRELFQYFIRLSFRTPGWQTGEYPSHFFTALKDLSRCVS